MEMVSDYLTLSDDACQQSALRFSDDKGEFV